MMPADILSGVGATRRGEAQAAIDEARTRHQFAQEEPWRRLERMSSIWRPLTEPYGKTTSETQQQASGAQIIGQTLGAAAGLGGMFSGFRGGGYAGSGGVPMPDTMGGFGPVPRMYGMGSMTPMMGMYNPMQYRYQNP